MKKYFRNLFDKMHHSAGDNKYLRTTVDAFDTFMFTPNETTKGRGVQIRDGMDLKRTMIMVVLPLMLLYIAGSWNIGNQHYLAAGMEVSMFKKFLFGLLQIIPMFIVVHVVGLGIEFIFAANKGHNVEEGFLVSGALIPLIMPPATPLWIVAIAVAFAVIIAKEAFGGTGMNIWNVALTARVFVFFAYPSAISGDIMPILNSAGEIEQLKYVWIQTGHNLLHQIFGGYFDIAGYTDVMKQMATGKIDAYSGATPLGVAAKHGFEGLKDGWTYSQLFWGNIPGSVGEMFKPLIILGGLWLIITRVASWRIIVGFLIGMTATGLLFNALGSEGNVFMQVPVTWHYVIGSALFAMAFMATDPVTAAQTTSGKWVYGIMIGVIGMIVRVINPAYPEGWMLAILFMNTFAPLIDHIFISRNIKKRLKDVATA